MISIAFIYGGRKLSSSLLKETSDLKGDSIPVDLLPVDGMTRIVDDHEELGVLLEDVHHRGAVLDEGHQAESRLRPLGSP